MKTKNLFSALAFLGALILFSACTEEIAGTDETLNELKSAALQPGGCIASGTATEEEAAGLLFMFEEEKLARDVYSYLSTLYSLPVFRNITKSEQVHMNAVRRLIEGFEIKADDIFSKGPGVYTNNELQNMYADLINKGKGSLVDALKAGVLIEETDIEDLEIQLAEVTNQSIMTVYSHLLAASKVHLRAFQSKL